MAASIGLPPLLNALLLFSMCWVLFCYLKLLCHYTMWRWETAGWRIVLKTVFWWVPYLPCICLQWQALVLTDAHGSAMLA